MTKAEAEAMKDAIVGYDHSRSMHDLAILCPECGANVDTGPALYVGEEWGGSVPDCERCGAEICGLESVDA